VKVRVDEVAAPKANGTAWNAPGNIVMTLRGVEIALPRTMSGGRIELSVSANDEYALTFLRDGRKVDEKRIVQPVTVDGSLLTHTVPGSTEPFDAIRVIPSGGDSQYSLGHLRLQ